MIGKVSDYIEASPNTVHKAEEQIIAKNYDTILVRGLGGLSLELAAQNELLIRNGRDLNGRLIPDLPSIN